MAEQMWVFSPGDRFATLSRGGKPTIYVVGEDGTVRYAPPEEESLADRVWKLDHEAEAKPQ